MSSEKQPIVSAVDGSPHSWTALEWAAREAVRRGLPLTVVHVRPLTRRTVQEEQLRESDDLLAEAVRRTAAVAPDLRPGTLAPLDFPAAALIALGRDAAMVVLGSRGLGGFRSLMLGSNSLAVASMATCPVVVAHSGRRDENGTDGGGEPAGFPDIVAGVAADETSDAVLDFAFTTADTRPGARLRVVHGWTMFSSMLAGGPVFDRDAAGNAVGRSLAELTAGWQSRFPGVEVVREPVSGSAGRTLVTASATAALTVVGRRRGGESLGLGLSPVAQTTVTHALGPVAVVPC
ncbi:universal stress protein [uncultured Streptomyces sp.]|uniref:universal stress protein n=1 Tax=uncultured Streptomyces sp. TaxID=174707 RepID=UPI0026084CE2|nr:universal stress protein [uncultured Streptomyces sp.]